MSKNVLLSQNQGFDLQGISFFKISLDQRHYLPNQNVFQLWWKGIAYLWKKNLKHLLVENSFHSRLDGNTLEGGQKWFARCKPILLKDNILQRFYMCPWGARAFPFKVTLNNILLDGKACETRMSWKFIMKMLIDLLNWKERKSKLRAKSFECWCLTFHFWRFCRWVFLEIKHQCKAQSLWRFQGINTC